MAEVFIQALLEAVPEGKVAGIYVKGSVLKPWDSPLDYVPELSDVDIHVLFADDAFAGAGLASVERSLAVGARSVRLYAEQVPRPLHLPRVQAADRQHALPLKSRIPSHIADC